MSHNRDFRDYKKRKLSASTNGRGLKVGATTTPGTLIHTSLESVGANEWDEVFLYAVNTSANAVKLTIEWGSTSSPDDRIVLTIPPESGLTQVVPGLVLQGTAAIRAFAATTNVVTLHGYVNRYEQTQ